MALTRKEKLRRRRVWYKANAVEQRARRVGYSRARRKENPEKCREETRRSAAKRHLTLRGRADSLFESARRRARLKGLPFDLTREWVLERLRAACELTGIKFVLERGKGAGNRHAFAPSIDRRIAGAGYTRENCRVIVWCLNAALATWGEGDLLTAVTAWMSRRV